MTDRLYREDELEAVNCPECGSGNVLEAPDTCESCREWRKHLTQGKKGSTMTGRDNLVLESRRLFVAWANEQEPDEGIRLNADDTDYFYTPSVMSDTMLGFQDRLLHVYQGLNDELHSVEFVILCDDHYKEVKALIIEADTNYSVVKAPE